MIKGLKRLKERFKKFKGNLNERNKKLLSILMFLLKFGLASLPLYAIYYSNINFRALEYSEAFLTNLMLKAVGLKTQVLKVVSPDTGFLIPGIKIGEVMMGVDRPCTGYRSYFALLGLIFATPNVKLKKRLKGAFFGAIGIYFINIFRLLITSIIGFYIPKALGWVDKLLWGWGLISVVLGLWLIWIKELGILKR